MVKCSSHEPYSWWKLCTLWVVVGLFSCSQPASEEVASVSPESSGTVAAPSGSAVVTQVNSSTADGAYKAGDIISVRVTFGLTATVTGTPRVMLETGNTDRYANYVSGSGGTTLVFSYTVQNGDVSSDLSYVNINSLELNGGSIAASTGAMNLSLPGLGASGSLSVNRALVIDTTTPVMAGSVTDGTYHNSLTESPTLSWVAGTDTGGSGISKYQIAIGSSSGGTEILSWTDIGNVTTHQVTTGISLNAGITYYPTVRAVDLAGNISAAIVGDGWIVDTTPPSSPATVYDGVSSYDTTSSPGISWTTSTDVGGSGLAKYQLALGTSAGATDVLTWTDIGTVISYTRTGLTLAAGTTYYASIRAIDNAGNIATAQGDGWQVVTCDTYGWCPQAYIKAPNGDSFDFFGRSLSLHRDTLVAGVNSEASNQTTITNGTTASSDNSVTASGAVYVFKRAAGTTWSQEAYIKATNAGNFDNFGASVSVFGDYIAVGAYGESSNLTTITNATTASSDNSATMSGAIYIYKRTGTTWSQEAYIKASNSSGLNRFGEALALDWDTLAVGVPRDDSNQITITNGTTSSSNTSFSEAGAVFIYKRSGSTWTQQAYIKAPNAGAGDEFGTALDVSGDSLIVGASLEDSNQTTITNGTTASADNSMAMAGAAYIFKRTGNTWAQEAYLKPPNPGAMYQYGSHVAIDRDTAVVGNSGDSSNQTTITNGTTASSDTSVEGSGAAYVYKRSGSTWVQEAYLKASNAETLDTLLAVDIQGDLIVASAFGEKSAQATVTNGTSASADNSLTAAGATYVFKREGTTWSQVAYLKSPNANYGDNFGMAPHIDGETIAVGASGESSNQTTITNGTLASSDNSTSSSGAAYVFSVNTQDNWQQQAYVKAPNAEAGDYFGNSLGISGDTLVVGARAEDSNQTTITNGTTASGDNSLANSGAVYVFKRTGATWAPEAYLKAANAGGNDYFSSALDIDRDTVAVGAFQEASNQTTITNGTTASGDNSASFAGAAYVFKRTGTTWAQEAYLKAANAETGDNFGTSIAIYGDTIAVGATAEASNETTISNGTTASSNNSSPISGAVYVYKRTGTTWAQEAYIKAANSDVGLFLGGSLDLQENTLVVGATGDASSQTTITNGTTASSDTSAGTAGAVFVYKRTGNTWAQEAYLKASNAAGSDNFGTRVSLDGDTVVVGAYGEDSNQTTITNGTAASSDNSASSAGAAYVFVRSGNTWSQQAYLKASNSDGGDMFGFMVSVQGNTIVVGSYQEDSAQTTITNNSSVSSADNSSSSAGAAYVFKRTGAVWTQQAYLKPTNGEASDWFGLPVMISGDTVAVGAYREDSNQTTVTNGTTASSDNSAADSGAVYIFKR